MTPRPSGQIRESAGGRQLILVREFEAGVEDVWAALTEPDRAGLWFASWTGEPGAGKTIEFTMTFEEGATPQPMLIMTCDPPRRLEVRFADDAGSWHLDVELTKSESGTVLQLIHHLDDAANLGEVGPGWEYYLDNLVAAQSAGPRPDFDDYFPSQRPFYEMLGRR